MVYVISDIHGEYALFLKLLNKINFSENDTLYVLGDMIDKGCESVRLLQFLKDKRNVKCILGNHEYEFLKKYHAIMRESPTDFNTVLKSLQDYFSSDGYLLDWETVDWLESLPFYVKTPYFIGVHAGIPLKIDKNLEDLKKVLPEQFVYDRNFKSPNVLPNTNKCVFFGHTPTSYISGESKIICYKREVLHAQKVSDYIKIHLDTGVFLNGVLGCFCVDNCTVHYVYKNLESGL